MRGISKLNSLRLDKTDMVTLRTIARTGIAALLALTLSTSCKKEEGPGPKTLTDLSGWIIYTTTDGDPVDFWNGAAVNSCIDDTGYEYYDKTKGVRYFHVSDLPEKFSGGFYNFSNLKTIDLTHVDFSNCSDFESLFMECVSLEKVEMSGLNLQNVKTMERMFYKCANLKEVKMSGCDASNVRNMSFMFEGCTSLETMDFTGVKSSSCVYLDGMFTGCSALRSFNLAQVGSECTKEGTCGMFYGCTSLETIDLRGINFGPHDMSNYVQISKTLSNASPSVVRIPALLTDKIMACALDGVNSDGTLYYPKGSDPQYALVYLQNGEHKWVAVAE